jgi:hypothetical protein
MLKQKELIMNLFDFVKDVTVKHDNAKALDAMYQNFGWDLRQEDVDMYIETREELRAVRLKNEKSKCPKNPNFRGFKCDDCDCKDWD